MTLGKVLTPAGGPLGPRFLVVSYLPTLFCALLLLMLVWAGAPSADLDPNRVWTTAAELGVGELVLLWLGITLVAVVSHPLQLGLVRVLQGQWPRWLGPLARFSSRRQERLRARLRRQAVVAGPGSGISQDVRNRMGEAQTDLRLRFPPTGIAAQPTALGNVIVAMEYVAGSAYCLDSVVVWPRLYPLLRPESKAVVDDHRDAVDTGCRLAATVAVTAVVAAGLLLRAGGYWLLIVFALFTLVRVAYRGAVSSAVGYGIAVNAAFDTHRFDLYKNLRLPFPANPAAERAFNVKLSLHWRQGQPDQPPPEVEYCETGDAAGAGTQGSTP
ncbi:hypothetical protein OG524_13550 [Streptomyces sp. NBC_01520]|uniref:hypothetical protein n=1 Tax=Streptomyces sp. NBC_01520 TaxID=2903892 RepID=UPI00386E1EB6